MGWVGRAGELDRIIERGYRYALALTHDFSAAEDLVQDAWLIALESGNTRHVGFLLRTIRDRFLDIAPRESLVMIEPLAENDAKRAAMALDDDLLDDDLSLEKALSALRAEEREALYLAAVEAYTANEIGELQGRPVDTVLELMSRARRKLLDAAARSSGRGP